MRQQTQIKRSRLLLSLVSMGIIAGFIYGLYKSILYINANEYVTHKLYNISLFISQYYITTYTLIGLSMAFLLVAVIFISKKLAQSLDEKKSSSRTKNIATICSIIASVFLIGLLFIYYPIIIAYIKTTNASSWLASFSNSAEHTLSLFILISAFLGIYAIVFILFTFWHNSSENTLRTILGYLNFNLIKFLGVSIIIAVFAFNIFVFGYKKLNTPEGPNIVFICIDTLRADRLGSYGNPRDTSPNIDKLGKQGILYENAFSQAPWTLPSMISMFTSLYPSDIGAKGIHSNIKYRHLTISEYLKNNFYDTIAVISHIVVSKIYGFSQGFDIFDQRHIAQVDEISSKIITEQAIEYLNNHKNDKFFLWVHYFDPHHNYIKHLEYNYSDGYSGQLTENLDNSKLNKRTSTLVDEDIEYIKDVYDEEISYTDKYIGVLLDSIEELGLKDDTIIVLTSDHGEEFMERTRIGHGGSLYRELIHVPLIIYNPLDIGNMGKRVSKNIEVRNITKTILEEVGLETDLFEGINLTDQQNLDLEHIVISENYGFEKSSRREAIIYKNWKLINDFKNQTSKLYEIQSDPEERINLLSKNDQHILDKKTELENILHAIRDRKSTESGEAKLSSEDIKQLKALGYIQ